MVRLMKLEVPCEIVHIETTDIVAQLPEGLIRIQVKSSQFKRNQRGWLSVFAGLRRTEKAAYERALRRGCFCRVRSRARFV